MKEVARLHGIMKAIVLDRDSKFTTKFWKGLFKGFGTSIKMSKIYMRGSLERQYYIMPIHIGGLNTPKILKNILPCIKG